MYQSRHRVYSGLLLAILAASPAVQAAEVTEYVPRDALGFTVLRNMAATSGKLESLANLFPAPVPSPLEFFKLRTGFDEGFNEDGDLLIALLPAADEFASPSPLALVPVADYAAFVKTFKGDPSGEICPVIVSDEEVLVAKKGEYALFMNPDARGRMQQIVAAEPAPIDTAGPLREWLTENDAALVVLPAGARMLVGMATEGLENARSQLEQGFEDLEMEEEMATIAAAFKMYDQLLSFVGDEVTTAALGLVLDDAQNVTFGIRAVASEGGQIAQLGEIERTESPLAALPAEKYVVAGGGPWPQELTDAMLGFSLDLMKSMPDLYGLQEASDEDMRKLEDAFKKAVEGLRHYSFLMQPGEGKEPIYSNMYMIFDVADAQQYLTNYKESLSIWAEIATGSEGAKFDYQVEEEEVAGNPGVKLTMDFTEAMGAAAFPQAAPMMELMFGPEGKMRAFVAQVDEDTVLVGYSPKPTVEAMVEKLRQGKGELADEATVTATRKLLPEDAPFVAYISPQGCVDWARRMISVMMGAFGGGGPVIPDYPETPPVGIAAGLDGQVIETDVVLPAEMLKGLSQYIQQNQ